MGKSTGIRSSNKRKKKKEKSRKGKDTNPHGKEKKGWGGGKENKLLTKAILSFQRKQLKEKHQTKPKNEHGGGKESGKQINLRKSEIIRNFVGKRIEPTGKRAGHQSQTKRKRDTASRGRQSLWGGRGVQRKRGKVPHSVTGKKVFQESELGRRKTEGRSKHRTPKKTFRKDSPH